MAQSDSPLVPLLLMGIALLFLVAAQYARAVKHNRPLTNLLVVGGLISGTAWIGWALLYLP